MTIDVSEGVEAERLRREVLRNEVAVTAEVDAAAAPAMARALALVEWGDQEEVCRACFALYPRHGRRCYVDAALAAAGLTHADREAVRRAER